MLPQRDTRLDAARGLGMLLVLYGHLLEPLFLERSSITPGPAFAVWRTIYAFHMPFFFLICGVTDRLKERDGCGAAALSALKLVLIALAFSTLALIPQIALGARPAAEALADNLRGSGFGLAPLWFLVTLGLLRVIDALAAAAGRGSWLVLSIALGVSWACAEGAFKVWHLYSLVGALPFYVLGRRAGPAAFDVPAPLGICGLAILLLCAPDNLAHVSSGQYGSLPLFAATSVGGCGFMLALVGRLRGPVLTGTARTGRASFDLFIVSGIVLLLSPALGPLDTWAGLAALAAVGLPLLMAAAALLHRPIRAVRTTAEALADGLVRRRLPRPA